MKKAFVFIMLLVSIAAYSQDEILPENIESAFKAKYPVSKLDNWVLDSNCYYLEFSMKGNMYTSVFDENGQWNETSEVISDYDIPTAIIDYVKKTYPSIGISYAEKVENSLAGIFLRINLQNDDEVIVLKSDVNGKNIEVISVTD